MDKRLPEWSSLAGLLGVGPGPIRWERPLLWLGAFFCGQLISDIYSTFQQCLTERSFRHLSFSWSMDWLFPFLFNLILIILAMFAFRFLTHPVLATVVLAIVYVPFSRGYSYFHLKTIYWLYADDFTKITETPRDLTIELLFSFLWALAFFGFLALALRWLRPLWVALVVGYFGSQLLYVGSRCLYFWLTKKPEDLKRYLTNFLPFSLVDALVFASALSLLWLICRDKLHDSRAQTPRLRRGFYVGTQAVINGMFFFFCAWTILMFTTEKWKEHDIPGALIMLGILFLLGIYSTVVFCVLIYKSWAAIQDIQTGATPGQALGLLFVPFYNLYWGFRVFAGFAKQYKAYVQRQGRSAARLSPGLGIAYMVLCLVSIIPVLDFFLLPVFFIIQLLLTAQWCRAVNALNRTADQPSAGAVEAVPIY